jgi:uncharacterized membrane protein (DUF106 family)
MPISTLLVAATAIGLNTVSQIITRAKVDLKKERRIREEVTTYQKNLREAIRTGNKKEEEKLKKKQKNMRELQTKLSTGRLKVQFYFWIPFIAIYWGLAYIIGDINTPVAVAPFAIPYLSASQSGIETLALFWWYFISSLTFSGMISKLAGTSMT